MIKFGALVIVFGFLSAACSATADSTTTSSTTLPSTTTTTSAPTSAPPTIAAFADPSENSLRADQLAAAGIGDEYFPTLGNPGYDVDHYILDLVFDPESTELKGIVTIAATATSNLNTVNLDFSNLTATVATVDGAPAEFGTVEEDIVVVPASPIPNGEEFVVEIEYGGTPGQARSAAVPFGIGWQTVNGQNYIVAEPDAGHTWFPSNDHPRDKATYTFRINVPDGTTAAANGNLVDQITDLGRVTWVWEVTSPMASYLATMVIGDFDVVEDEAGSAAGGVPIRHVLPAGTTIEDWPGLERQGEMIAFLEEHFGPYPFDTYGIAIVDGFGAALENQTLSLFDSGLARSAFFEDVLIHELAHQWFGDSVSPGRWQDIWLNEGFASYAEWLWIEREQSPAALQAGITQERNEFDGAGLPPPGAPPVFDLFGPSVYRVGAMTLHALRLTVGDDVFFEILRAYAVRFADGSAVTTDFVAVAEEIAGQDLQPLFDSWLYERPVPDFPVP